jgi:hypothetical protein
MSIYICTICNQQKDSDFNCAELGGKECCEECFSENENNNNATSPLELVMDYMQKRIDQIDETRRSFKAQYPDLLPAIE